VSDLNTPKIHTISSDVDDFLFTLKFSYSSSMHPAYRFDGFLQGCSIDIAGLAGCKPVLPIHKVFENLNATAIFHMALFILCKSYKILRKGRTMEIVV
jgi:hypothetical protein